VSTTGVVTARQEAGAADISASCTPPSCNIGVLPGLPIYSTGGMLPNGQNAFGVIIANVTQTKPPVASVFAATTDCNDAFNCTSAMFPITAGTNPIGSPVVLPYTPNSMTFNPAGTRAYLGSSKGLMFVDIGQSVTVNTVSPTTTPCNIAVCGKPLAISPDGNRVVVADIATQPNQVYIFDAAHATNAPGDLLIPGATAAAFSPDQMKIFILSNTGKMYVVSTVDALKSVSIAPAATDLAFAADGSFAYVAGTPGNNIAAFSTCSTPSAASANIGNVATAGTPLRIFPLPQVQELTVGPDHSLIAQNLLALEPPNIQLLTAHFTRDPLADNQFTCNLPVLTSFDSSAPVNLGQGTFTPLFTQVTGDGSQVIIVAKNIPAVLVFDVNGGTTSAFPLADNALPVAASATLDGTQVFVAGCQTLFKDDQGHERCASGASVHIVNTQSGGDIQQAVYTNTNTNDSMCSDLDPVTHPCTPNLLAVRPQ
jgi:DNA-binding beta-propeller fold protein YncE